MRRRQAFGDHHGGDASVGRERGNGTEVIEARVAVDEHAVRRPCPLLS
jgi:hypothetical protein